MSAKFHTIEPLSVVNLGYIFTNIDILKYLLSAKSDGEIAYYVKEINRQGKLHGNDAFNLRFDASLQSKDVRRRVFIKFAGMPCRS